MEGNKMSMNDMNLENNDIFKAGMEAGRKELGDHIVHQFEIGKPVEINGELYWLKDAKQNLMDIMDDIESAWNEDHGVKKFIVPFKKRSFDNEEIAREVIIQADSKEEAMETAINDFCDSGWLVDMDYENYRQFKG